MSTHSEIMMVWLFSNCCEYSNKSFKFNDIIQFISLTKNNNNNNSNKRKKKTNQNYHTTYCPYQEDIIECLPKVLQMTVSTFI